MVRLYSVRGTGHRTVVRPRGVYRQRHNSPRCRLCLPAVRALLAAAPRPLRQYEIRAALGGAFTQSSVHTACNALLKRGEAVRVELVPKGRGLALAAPRAG